MSKGLCLPAVTGMQDKSLGRHAWPCRLLLAATQRPAAQTASNTIFTTSRHRRLLQIFLRMCSSAWLILRSYFCFAQAQHERGLTYEIPVFV